MTVWFGLFNGLCLVPVLLSLVGPEAPPTSGLEDGLADMNTTKGQTCPQFVNKVNIEYTDNLVRLSLYVSESVPPVGYQTQRYNTSC